ncbi:MAG: acyltransferase family protein [Pseudorhodobacter sp.]|nr:acyltransferase family protein [Pseudorhodobacter sp.]
MALTYRPEIDGLRAIAVTAVILFHSRLITIPGGFVGVDIFFVLSGYLISALLLQEMEAGTYSLRGFYQRRVRRIAPALVFVLAVTSILAWAVMIPSQLKAYSTTLLSVILFISNFVFGARKGYFQPSEEEAPLLHTWSLAVEEQFYLLFPLLLWFVVRRAPQRVGLMVALLFVASLALAEWGWRHHPDINFFFTLSRFWELLAGTATALWLRRGPVWPQHGAGANALALAGLALIIAALALQSETTPYPSAAGLVPVGGTVLLILYARSGTWVARLLTLRPMVGIGLISYSAYLWHQPLFALARVQALEGPSTAVMVALTLASFGLAALSWRYVEQPFRRKAGRWLPDTHLLFQTTAAAALGLAVIAGLGIVTSGNNAGWRALHPDQGPTLDIRLAARTPHAPLPGDQSCRFRLAGIGPDALARITACAARHGAAPVVLGDSHAIDIYETLSRVSDAPFLIGFTAPGCHVTGPWKKCPFAALADLAATRPELVAHVLLVQTGTWLLATPDGREGSRQLFIRASRVKPIPPYPPDRALIARTISYLATLAQTVPVTWLAPRIEPHDSVNRVLNQGCGARFTLRAGQAEVFTRLDTAIAAAIARAGVPGLRYLPLTALPPFDMTTDFMTCGTIYWSDGDHWSNTGEQHFGPRLLAALPPVYR